MKHRFPREFYVPRGVAISWLRLKDCPLEIGQYSQAGRLFAIGFYGKAAKPAWHNRYRDSARRAAHIAEMIENYRASAARKLARQAERKAFVPTLKVGDVLNTCWGYDQTNREFYEVTAVRGKHVIVREIAQHIEETGFMCGTCAPKVGEYIGPELYKLVGEGNNIRISSCITAHPYAMHEVVPGAKVGAPVYWSAYA